MLFIAIIYSALLWQVIKPYWRILRAQARYGGGRLQFTIADCWGASLGLSITAFLVALSVGGASEMSDPKDGVKLVLATALFFGASQIAGAVIVLSTSMSPARAASAREHAASAWLVAIGSILGLLLPLMGPFLLFFQMREETAAAGPRKRRMCERARATRQDGGRYPNPKGSQPLAGGCER